MTRKTDVFALNGSDYGERKRERERERERERKIRRFLSQRNFLFVFQSSHITVGIVETLF